VSIVDEHVEMAKKVGPQNSTDVHVGSQGIVELRNKNLVMGYGKGAHFNQLQLRKGSLRWEAYGEHSSLAPALQLKFSSQGWIDRRDLCPGVHQKVIRPGVVDCDRNNYLRTLDETEGQIDNISRTTLLCG
jgi:hypothetical protein